jgi:hypothetical protein
MDAHDIITRHVLQQLARRVIPWHIPLSDLGMLSHFDTHSPLTACEAFVARIADMPTIRVGEIMAYEPASREPCCRGGCLGRGLPVAWQTMKLIQLLWHAIVRCVGLLGALCVLAYMGFGLVYTFLGPHFVCLDSVYWWAGVTLVSLVLYILLTAPQ